MAPEEYEGSIRLDLWISTIHGDLWYREPDSRRAVELRIRVALQREAILVTTHLTPNKILAFDGLSRNGSGQCEIMTGVTVLQYFERRGIAHLDPNLPCV